jgi:GNAT superfamily N-acetyltransferase
MHIATAVLEDIPRLCELLGLLFSQEEEFSPDAEKQARGLAAIIGDPSTGIILVLREGEKIVGTANLLFTVSTFMGAKVVIMEDMIIDPAHRRQGAGTMLLQAAKEIAKGRGCKRITLLTDGTDERAKTFYRKMGFVDSPMVPMRLML